MKHAVNRYLHLFLVLALMLSVCLSSVQSADAKSPSKYTWSEKTAPNYVVRVGKAKVSGKPKKGKIKYARLDKYGRTGRAVGNITYKMVKTSAGWREEFTPECDPAGWGKNKIVEIELPSGKCYRGYLWNRSHLIADSLGGRATRKNLITGTRMQNVGANDGKGGMAYAERKCVKFLYKHKKANIYYSATPVYKGNELVPRSVIVDFKSYGKGGTGRDRLNERVIVYNAAKGFNVNYKTGMDKDDSSESSSDEEASPSPVPADTVFITRSGTKYHLDKSCSGLSNAKSIFETTKASAEADGKTLCAICAQTHNITN